MKCEKCGKDKEPKWRTIRGSRVAYCSNCGWTMVAPDWLKNKAKIDPIYTGKKLKCARCGSDLKGSRLLEGNIIKCNKCGQNNKST